MCSAREVCSLWEGVFSEGGVCSVWEVCSVRERCGL